MLVLSNFGLVTVACGVVWLIFNAPFDLFSRRNRDRLQAGLAAVLIGLMMLAPSAVQKALDWYAKKQSDEIVEQVNKILPSPTSTSTTTP